MHTCPECGQACSCGGDIDDLLDIDEEGAINCTHFQQCEAECDDDNGDWIHDPDMGAR